MKFFSADGPLYRFISRFWDMVKINFFWLLCSLPLVTYGAATAAAFTVTLQMIDETEGYVGRAYWKAFRANLKQGCIVGILQLVCMYAVYLDLQFYSATDSVVFLILGIVAAFVFFMGFIYAYPLMARYENTIPNIIKNSHDIATKYFLRTLALAALLALEVVVFLWNKALLTLGVLIGPACIMLTISAFALPFFREIEKENKSN